MPDATITRSGNVLEVKPAFESILGRELTYTHRQMNYVRRRGPGQHQDISFLERKLYRIDQDRLYTLQGALQLVTEALRRKGLSYEYHDLRPVRNIEPDYEYFATVLPDLVFRLKQDEILATLVTESNGIIVAPTAYGKTFIMLALVALYPKSCIIIASPHVTLLNSTYRRMLKITQDVGCVGGGRDAPGRVTLATFGSIMKAPVKECDILLIDEAHRAVAPQISQNLACIRSAVKIFGMTATAKGRSDGAERAMEVLIGPEIYKIEYEEAAQAGVVSKIKVVMSDLPAIDMPSSASFRMKPTKKRHCYWRNSVRNQTIARACQVVPQQHGFPQDCQTLVLAETTQHAFHLARYMPDYTVVYANMDKERLEELDRMGVLPANYVPLTTKQREVLQRDFEEGKLRKVIATGCWGEGVDFVYLDVLCNASGSASPIDIVQWSGRNSRMHDGKLFGLVLDFNDAWDKWTLQRTKSRLSIYRKYQWELISATLTGSATHSS